MEVVQLEFLRAVANMSGGERGELGRPSYSRLSLRGPQVQKATRTSSSDRGAIIWGALRRSNIDSVDKPHHKHRHGHNLLFSPFSCCCCRNALYSPWPLTTTLLLTLGSFFGSVPPECLTSALPRETVSAPTKRTAIIDKGIDGNQR